MPEPEEKKATTAPKPTGPEKLTPAQWAERRGLVGQPDPNRPWVIPTNDWRFAAADSLHGWTEHAYNYQAEADQLLLTEQDFDAALEAGALYPAKPAHEPACGKGFEHRAKPLNGEPKKDK